MPGTAETNEHSKQRQRGLAAAGDAQTVERRRGLKVKESVHISNMEAGKDKKVCLEYQLLCTSANKADKMIELSFVEKFAVDSNFICSSGKSHKRSQAAEQLAAYCKF